MSKLMNPFKQVASTVIALTLAYTLVLPVPTYAWNSSEDPTQETTHVFLVDQGLKILQNDLSQADRENSAFMAVLDQFQKDLPTLKRGSVAPDYWEKQYLLFQDHFYDPVTKQNFTSLNDSLSTTVLDYVYPNALSRTKTYTGWAFQLWNEGKKTEALYEFGKAMHYFSDLCEPHHASNAIGGTLESKTKHSAFETYVDTKLNSLALTTAGGQTNSFPYARFENEPLYSGYITQLANETALESQHLYKTTFDPQNEGTWVNTAQPALQNAQRAVSQAIYRFAKDLTIPTSESNHTSATDLKLKVRVKTTSGNLFKGYGTDNDVFFGVELKNGRIMEWPLDKPGYNDHENGDNDTYPVTLEKATGQQIQKAWIRKQRGWSAGSFEDNWHLQEVEVTTDDQSFQCLKPVSNWLKGNIDLMVFTR